MKNDVLILNRSCAIGIGLMALIGGGLLFEEIKMGEATPTVAVIERVETPPLPPSSSATLPPITPDPFRDSIDGLNALQVYDSLDQDDVMQVQGAACILMADMPYGEAYGEVVNGIEKTWGTDHETAEKLATAFAENCE